MKLREGGKSAAPRRRSGGLAVLRKGKEPRFERAMDIGGICKPRIRGGCFAGLLIRKTTARSCEVCQKTRAGKRI